MPSSFGLLAGHDSADHADSDGVVERSADRADAGAVRAVAWGDGAEQKADRGAAQVAGRWAGENLTARLAGDMEQETGPRAVVLAQANWTDWAEGGYRRVLCTVRDHASHGCCTTGRTPSGGYDNYR
jgi:hypothetical protein